MKSFRCSIVVAALTVLPLATSAQSSQSPSDADWDWLARYRRQAFDALMQMDAPQVLAAYLSYRDTYVDVMERHFVIRFAQGGAFDRNKLSAAVIVPVGRSIQRQLLDLHMRDRSASLESVMSRLEIRRLTLEVSQCRAVADRLDSLSNVRIILPERNVIHLHPFMHRVVIDFGGGRIDATLHDENDALVRWAGQTNDALLACAGG